jgi:WhiB family redox-sensing transcriptional regulator
MSVYQTELAEDCGIYEALQLGLLACLDADPNLFFAENPAQLEQAKGYCQRCPAQRACLAAALERREATGVWGGEIFERGHVIPDKRPRGRPRRVRTED